MASEKGKCSLLSLSELILIMASFHKLLLVVHKKKGISATQEASTTGQQQTNSTPDSHPQQELKAYPESEETLTAQPQSPSPEAEYDKLLVSKYMLHESRKIYSIYIV